MKVLSLTKYGRMGASSRMRSLQYQPYSAAAGYEVATNELIDDRMLSHRYQNGRYSLGSLLYSYVNRFLALLDRSNFDVLWIEKEALPWFPASIELILLRGVPYVIDYDDAVFHSYDLHRSVAVRKLFGNRLDRLMAKAALVTAGNKYLAKRAIDAGAKWVEVLPTVVDLERYPRGSSASRGDVLRIVWIGSPSTAHYLTLLREPLKQLAFRYPFVLRVIGAKEVDIPGVDIEYVVWSENSEVDSISSCAIGIMPLVDSPWERGKCGYKLIQYMACYLPVVASPVGANVDIVDDGVNGFLVASANDWVTALSDLLQSSELRVAMGDAGRARVEEKYCLQRTGPLLVELLRRVAEK
ncbi:MAG: glycosyltransferase [Cytophagaceae bacterium]|nr:MAG: glycosyltransferase [Cytophagaceae bacterium]